MKAYRYLILFLIISPALQAEDTEDSVEMLERHAQGSEKLADEQDELSADVQQLVIEMTEPEVIELLSEVEEIMDETTDYLAETETGGGTIAAQTDIIEKIYDAVKAKQQQGSGESGSAMMDMMERMMGKKKGEGKGKEEKGDKPGDQAGKGMNGESDAGNEANGGTSDGKIEKRTVPKMAGTAGKSLPREFQQALDAYNRGLERKKP